MSLSAIFSLWYVVLKYIGYLFVDPLAHNISVRKLTYKYVHDIEITKIYNSLANKVMRDIKYSRDFLKGCCQCEM